MIRQTRSVREPELLPVRRGSSPPVSCLALKEVQRAQPYSPIRLMGSPLEDGLELVAQIIDLLPGANAP